MLCCLNFFRGWYSGPNVGVNTVLRQHCAALHVSVNCEVAYLDQACRRDSNCRRQPATSTLQMSTAVYFVYTSGPSLSTPSKLPAFGYSGGSARMQMLAVSCRDTTAINTTTAGLVNDSMRNDGFRWLVTGEHVHVNPPPPYDALARVKTPK